MITLTTILNLSDRDQQKFLSEVENNKELALALQCDDNSALITSLAGNMSKRCAEIFREELTEAKKIAEKEKETLSEPDALPASVLAAREKMLSVVTRLSESGEIKIPEVEIPKTSVLFEKRIKDAKRKIRETICATQENRAILRKYIIEEAEKLDDLDSDTIAEKLGGYGEGNDLKSLELEFMKELEEVTSNFFKKHLIESKSETAYHALVELGSEGRRQLKARLLSEHYDSLLRAVEESTLAFEDIVLLDDRSVQRVLREIDYGELAKSLKGVDYEVQSKIFRNMSKRAAAMLKEDIELLGPVKRSDICAAQDKILAVITRLENSGEIVIALHEELGDYI